ncbi:purple acid phosphatase family protein [Paenibacillus typhae]|uniref:Purple acid Phosphatase, N-terminal domain n=1 Tax=Paenibacillus typhae TaxID=1174501 RepID=A0A1G9AG26_9BACL|nr:metallophosphoesterase family protein [Paenibacillus typhae]SDK25465.1 Purple acid Phosphatase, N-terminal domain [Paenibacillus typhae]
MKDLKIVLIIGIIFLVLIVAAVVFERLKAERAEAGLLPGTPYNLVTTFKGDAATSRAFTWYTEDAAAAGRLEVVKGENASFDGTSVIRVQAEDTTIKTDAGKRGVHKAEVSGLEPDTVYTYRAGSGEDGEWSAAASFTTAEADTDEVTFINVTDSQGITAADFAVWGRTLNKAFETFPAAQFIVHNGDFTEEAEDSSAWNSFFSNVDSLVTRIPLMPVTGNHDEVDEQAAEFTSHFNVPDNGAKGSIAGTSYSFDYGAVHVTVLNTESNLKKQTEWLKKDLASTDKAWKIVAMHRPAYGGNTYKKLDDWVELFDKYKVDLVLQGHNHEYSRSYPLLDGKVVTEKQRSAGAVRGTVYVVTNASGNKFNEKKEDQFYHAVHFQNNMAMFAGITISGKVLSYQAYDVDGNKLDEFTLTH